LGAFARGGGVTPAIGAASAIGATNWTASTISRVGAGEAVAITLASTAATTMCASTDAPAGACLRQPDQS
jgi:hypothetical protein